MPKELKITFGKSSSQNYSYAVELASQYDTYEQIGEGKDIIHSVTFSFEKINDFFELYDLVGRWKSTSIFIDGEKLPPSGMSFLWCYKEHLRAYNPSEYCHGKDDAHSHNDNDFGCRHTGINLYGWYGLSGYGEMDKQGNFHVNKDKLKHDIMKNLENYRFCPALNMEKIQKAIDAIPDVINPNKHRSWEYVTDYDEDQQIAVAVRKKERQKGYTIKETDNDYHKTTNIEIAVGKHTGKSTGCLLPFLFTMLFIMALFIIL